MTTEKPEPIITSYEGVSRLFDVLMTIMDNPASWDQEVWGSRNECRTSGCLAGHAVYKYKDALLTDDSVSAEIVWYDAGLGDFWSHVALRDAHGETIKSFYAPEAASQIFGVSDDALADWDRRMQYYEYYSLKRNTAKSWDLYEETNTFSDLVRIADALTGGKIKKLARVHGVKLKLNSSKE